MDGERATVRNEFAEGGAESKPAAKAGGDLPSSQTRSEDRRRRYTVRSKSITVNMDTELLAELDDWVRENTGARSAWIALMVRYCLDHATVDQLLLHARYRFRAQ